MRIIKTQPVDPDRSRGLYGKYYVRRLVDTDGKHGSCRYFVLDPQHDKIAREALALYRDKAKDDGYEDLARDLTTWLEALDDD